MDRSIVDIELSVLLESIYLAYHYDFRSSCRSPLHALRPMPLYPSSSSAPEFPRLATVARVVHGFGCE